MSKVPSPNTVPMITTPNSAGVMRGMSMRNTVPTRPAPAISEASSKLRFMLSKGPSSRR